MYFRRLLLSCAAAQVLTLAAPQAFAQSAPTPVLPYNIGDAVRQAEEARPAPPRQAATPVLPQIAEPRFTLASKETLFVKHLVVEGPTLVDEAELREILAPYEGRKLTLGDIYGAADKVTLLYRGKGYLVAKAYVPAQDARSGSLKIKLVIGKYGSVLVRNSSAVDTDFLQGVVDSGAGRRSADPQASAGARDAARVRSAGGRRAAHHRLARQKPRDIRLPIRRAGGKARRRLSARR